MKTTKTKTTNVEVVDLFCGVGALSHGLKKAGFIIKAGYDMDSRCRFAFEENNDSIFYARDVSTLTPEEIRAHYSQSAVTILAGCAPCQPFSTYKHRYEEDPRWNLVSDFADIATKVQPDFVTMENVPALLRYQNGAVFHNFCEQLSSAGYEVSWSVAKCEEFGVPQRRRRLVLIASRNGNITPLMATHPKKFVTVKQAIGKLPKIAAGKSDKKDRFHASASLSDLNLKRIQASKPGGTWRDWPENLVAPCHARESGRTYPGVYARMSWDEPAPTMTTQCYGYGNGRFGHPEQDRAISLREAAILQSFPKSYKFLPKEEQIAFAELGRWIGNAVPVKLGEAIGRSIVSSIQEQ